MQAIQPIEIQVAPVHDVERAGLDGQHVQHVDVAHLAVADVDEGRDGPAQVQQRVQLDGGLGGAKRRPVEQAQTQVDGGGVQGIDGVVQLDTQRLAGVELAGTTDQHGRKVRPDAPVARFVGVGQRRTLDRRAKSHRVQLGRVRRQTGLDVAQALAPGQLRERHGAELLGAGQRAHAGVAAMALHDAREAGPRHELHDLSEQGLADVHAHLQRLSSLGKYAVLEDRSSSRHQTKSAARPRQCLRIVSARLV